MERLRLCPASNPGGRTVTRSMILRLKILPRVRALHTSEPLRTLQTQADASAAHVAHLGGSARIARAVRAHVAALALVRVEQADELVALVRLHGLRHAVPEGGIQGCVVGPAGGRPVRLARRVLKLEDGPRAVQLAGGARIRVECVGVEALPG